MKERQKIPMFIVQCRIAATKSSSEKPLPMPSSWRILPLEDTIQNVVEDLLDGQYNNPVRVIGFDAAQRISRDVTKEVARELQQCCREQSRQAPDFLREFLDRCESHGGL
jgi:hypothetical protein